MKKTTILYLIIGVVILIFTIGGFYIYKFRECVKKISYVPPREQNATGGGFSGFLQVDDKGDYYRFNFQSFRTSDEALRACIWK